MVTNPQRPVAVSGDTQRVAQTLGNNLWCVAIGRDFDESPESCGLRTEQCIVLFGVGNAYGGRLPQRAGAEMEVPDGKKYAIELGANVRAEPRMGPKR